VKNVNYNIRLDPEVKARAEETFAAFGLNLSEAINVSLHMSIKRKGFPFEVVEPAASAETLSAIRHIERLFADGAPGKPPAPEPPPAVSTIIKTDAMWA
jgi:DNA-damage-inducible protein J